MTDLHTIAEMFAVLDGRERYELTQAEWVVRRAEIHNLNRRRPPRPPVDPARRAAADRADRKRYAAKHPEKIRAWRRKTVPIWNAAHPERLRAAWNRYAAKVRAKNDPAWRERKRAYDRAYRARQKVAA